MLLPDVHNGILPNSRVSVGRQGPASAGGSAGGSTPWELPFTVENANALQWLDCIDGVYLKDRVGQGTERILSGGPGLQRGRCYDFDGVDGYITATDASLQITGALSISLWVYASSTVTSDSPLIMNGSLSYGITYHNNSKVYFYINRGANGLSFTDSMSDGWHHIVGTFDGTTDADGMKLYIDGVEVATRTSSFATTGAGTTVTCGQKGSKYFDGALFGVLLYTTVLSADNVTYLHTFGKSGTNPTLGWAVIQWLMDEQSGTISYDSSGNELDATHSGGVTHTTQDIYSWHNNFGYTLSGAVFLPKDYGALSEVDINGDDLDYSGRAPFHGKAVNNRCGVFDGTAYLAIGSLTGSETVTSSEGTSTPTISAGRIDFTAGTCWNLLLSNGSKYIIAEGAGTTVYDVTSNAVHATLTSATLATFWAGTQDTLAYNLLGFRLVGDVRIPLREGTAIAADGAAITNPAGCWHDDAESDIDFNPFDIPELKTNQIGYDAYRTFSIRADEFKLPDQQWAHRESEIKIHHFATFDEALVTTDLVNARAYYGVIARLNAQVEAGWKCDETSAVYLGDMFDQYITLDAVNDHDLQDTATASDISEGTGVDGNQLDLYSSASLQLQDNTNMTAVTAFAVCGWLTVNDLLDDIDLMYYDSGQIQIGSNSSSQIFFTYNGTTITKAISSTTRYFIFAGIDAYGNMHLWVDGVWAAQGTSTILGSTNAGWTVGYGGNISSDAQLDEVYLFLGKRSRGMLMSQLYDGGAGNFISAGGVFSA